VAGQVIRRRWRGLSEYGVAVCVAAKERVAAVQFEGELRQSVISVPGIVRHGRADGLTHTVAVAIVDERGGRAARDGGRSDVAGRVVAEGPGPVLRLVAVSVIRVADDGGSVGG